MWPAKGPDVMRVAGQTRFGQRMRMLLALGMVGAIAWVLVATPLGTQLWGLLRDPNAKHLAQVLPVTATWLAAAIVGLMILHTLIPLPAEILAMAAGMALGPFWGFLTTWVGAMLGAFLGFFLARALGQPFLRHFVTAQYLTQWLQRLQHADTILLLAVRLLPVISFNLINYTLGLSPIGWWRFTWTTAVGIVPVTVFMVVFGSHLSDWRVLVLMTVAAVLVGVGGGLLLRRRSGTVLL